MHPSATAGLAAQTEEGWNIGAGVVWYFGGNARSRAINGHCGLPYMPVANNSTFLVDQGVTTPNPQAYCLGTFDEEEFPLA